ncbi:hypothetical protein [Secundilactobacillus folii]|uniref:Uncharacterized protein n=1 Tax=Secundilactobacillus folii TaxID=2678357 RepID=A0A7X3C3H7_9LACO|nr:hypothetical protein [Secundilactobacillus folii]MTV82304.1 hypothetical protein [Secundilactobacillus folii]
MPLVLAMMQLASKYVPKTNFPWDKQLLLHSYGHNLLVSVIIMLFIAVIIWIIRLAFDEKRD